MALAAAQRGGRGTYAANSGPASILEGASGSGASSSTNSSRTSFDAPPSAAGSEVAVVAGQPLQPLSPLVAAKLGLEPVGEGGGGGGDGKLCGGEGEGLEGSGGGWGAEGGCSEGSGKPAKGSGGRTPEYVADSGESCMTNPATQRTAAQHGPGRAGQRVREAACGGAAM